MTFWCCLLRSYLADSLSPPTLLEALETLQRRSLIATQDTKFSLQPLVREYAQAQMQQPRYLLSLQATG